MNMLSFVFGKSLGLEHTSPWLAEINKMPTNVSIDVDLTLIDKEGQLLPGAKDAVAKLQAADCKITLWSLAGAEYAKAVAARHKIEHLFVGFAGKPDVVIDDDLESIQPLLRFEKSAGISWNELVKSVLKQIPKLEGKTEDRNEVAGLVDESIQNFKHTRAENPQLFPEDNPRLNPILFFGYPFQAEVLTIALNPANTEFTAINGWEAGLSSQELMQKFLSYFSPDRLWHPWFLPIEQGLLACDCSYEKNAAHLDLCSLPTILPRHLGINQQTEFANLIQRELPNFRRLLRLCRTAKMVVVIDYPIRLGNQNEISSVLKMIRQHVPELAQYINNDGQDFPVIRGQNPRQLQEWLFENRRTVKTHLKVGEYLCFD
jgi:hypothetical protein